MEKIVIIIRKLRELVQKRATFVKMRILLQNGKWTTINFKSVMSNSQYSESKVVIPDIHVVVVHDNNSYIHVYLKTLFCRILLLSLTELSVKKN